MRYTTDLTCCPLPYDIPIEPPMIQFDTPKRIPKFVRQKQRKLPTNPKCVPVLTYTRRSVNLSTVLAHGRNKLQKGVKPMKRTKKGIRDDNTLLNNKRVRHSLQLWRTEKGLTANRGFVKKSASVLFHDTRYQQSFDSHPFFHKIPYACIRETFGNQPFAELRILEKHILELLEATKINYTEHKYGAN